ncbi:MAG TPA: NAD(P)-dependent oxidoreductase [Burkholderiales bacterium]|nr:NAD(P)-dependent oxidoreductase [Burkholderiales bacterium]
MIVVPDDFPSVFEGSVAQPKAEALGALRVYTERGADDETELARRIGAAQVAINIRAYAHFSDAVFRACPGLRMVSIWGTGTDNIDLAAAARRGVTVCNTPGVNAIAVAEHAIALMLAVARKIPAIDREMRDGAWPREMLTQLHGKTLGVFGTGSIGARVAELGRAFGMTVLAWSARGDSARLTTMGVTATPKHDILRRADFISLNLRLTAATRGFLGRSEFDAMKPTAILVNTGRGALTDRDALFAAIAGGAIAGAGLDVFHDEPVAAGDPLLGLTNTVLSPHNAGQTPEVRRDGLTCAVENAANFLKGTPTNVISA